MGQPMREEKAPSAGVDIQLEWGPADPLDQVMVDQLSLARANKQVYLIFGQTRIPILEGRGSSVKAEVRPMARLVVSEEAFAQIMKVLSGAMKDIGEGK